MGLKDMHSYLEKVARGELPMNHEITYHLQDIFNLLPDVTNPSFVRSLQVNTNDQMLVMYIIGYQVRYRFAQSHQQQARQQGGREEGGKEGRLEGQGEKRGEGREGSQGHQEGRFCHRFQEMILIHRDQYND